MQEDREPEVWKPIPDYEGIYEISSWGRVKSLEKRHNSKNNSIAVRKEKFLKCYVTDRNYITCRMYLGVRNSKYFQVHRLVAQSFLSKKIGFEQVNHIDKNPLNNYYKNLEWVNIRENQTHRYLKTKTSSIYPGVTYKKDGQRLKRWAAQIGVKGKDRCLGVFFTQEEAYQAYLNALKEYGLTNKYADKVK